MHPTAFLTRTPRVLMSKAVWLLDINTENMHVLYVSAYLRHRKLQNRYVPCIVPCHNTRSTDTVAFAYRQ